jgi:hypothetical protein
MLEAEAPACRSPRLGGSRCRLGRALRALSLSRLAVRSQSRFSIGYLLFDAGALHQLVNLHGNKELKPATKPAGGSSTARAVPIASVGLRRCDIETFLAIGDVKVHLAQDVHPKNEVGA